MAHTSSTKEDNPPFNLKQELYDYIEIIVLSIVVAFLVFTFIGRPATVSGESMLPTLQDGDRLLISKLFYKPKFGDIVVITKPNVENKPYIKRIIATEGQTVDIDFSAGTVAVDGVILEEPYINEATHLKETVEFPVKVPEGQVFVLGDNRNHSKDSRDTELGTFDEEYILGRCILRIFPNFGKVA